MRQERFLKRISTDSDSAERALQPCYGLDVWGDAVRTEEKEKEEETENL